jgi:hypothetical protein
MVVLTELAFVPTAEYVDRRGTASAAEDEPSEIGIFHDGITNNIGS